MGLEGRRCPGPPGGWGPPATPGPSAHNHSLIHLFKLNRMAGKGEPREAGHSGWGRDVPHRQSAGFHTPGCIRGFWLFWAFLTKTKCLFVLHEAQARPCEPGGRGGHEALGASAGHLGVQHACHSPVPVPVGSFRGSALAGITPRWVFDPAGCFTAARLCSPCQAAPALPSPMWDLPSLGEKSHLSSI